MALFITGHQRSGTTLLMRLVNSHPQVNIMGEFGNFWRINVPYGEYARFILGRWWKKRNASFVFDKKNNVKGVNMAQNLVFVTRYLREVYRFRQERIGVPSIEAALKILYPGCAVVGDKYPDYVFELKNLTAQEGLCGLFIMRDPRDVASSSVKRARTDWKDSWPEELRNPRNIALRWVQSLELVERYPSHLFTVRYEDLVTQPQGVMAQVGQWLDVDPRGFRHDIVRVDSVGKHSSGLTAQEVADVLEVAGSAMQRMGYTF